MSSSSSPIKKRFTPIPGPQGPTGQTGTTGLIGPTGPVGPSTTSPFAYAYMYNIGTRGTAGVYIVPQSQSATGPAGLLEFETIGLQNTSTGNWTFEFFSTNTNITGIKVPITGAYDIQFSVNGRPNSPTGQARIDFAIGTNGSATPSGIPGTTSTVSNATINTGYTFLNAVSNSTTEQLIGSAIVHLANTDYLRIINTQELYDENINSFDPTISQSPNLATLRISYIGP